MAMAAEERPLAPNDDLRSLSAWTWIDSTPEGLVSICLLTPGPMGPGELAMTTLAAAAGLATPDQPMAHSLVQLVLQGDDAVFTVRGTDIAIRVPADPAWGDFVRRDGTVVLLVGTHPLDRDAKLPEVEHYLIGSLLPRQLLMGKTQLTAAYSASQLDGKACVRCESTEAPLHPSATIPLRVSAGVVRDIVSVVCTRCLVIR